MPVSIIIPTYNRNRILERSLASLAEFAAEVEMEVIIVNDSKTNEVKVDPKHTFIKVLNNPKSGVASARNFGLHHAKNEKIIFLDDDMIVPKEVVLFVSSFLDEYPSCSVNIDWVYPEELRTRIKKTKFGRYLLNYGHADLRGWMDKGEWKDDAVYPVKMIASAILGIQKASVIKAGGYNEDFPFAGFEDHDFASRLSGVGIQGYLNTKLTVFHNEEDRVEMRSWLERRDRNAQTKAIGVYKLGYKDYAINYPGWKKRIFRGIYLLKGIYAMLLFMIPNHASFDRVFAWFFNPLLGAYIYNGYTKSGLDG